MSKEWKRLRHVHLLPILQLKTLRRFVFCAVPVPLSLARPTWTSLPRALWVLDRHTASRPTLSILDMCAAALPPDQRRWLPAELFRFHWARTRLARAVFQRH